MTIAVDAPQRIGRAFAIVDRLTRDHGLVTSEMVPALSTVAGNERSRGLRLARHDH